MRPSYAPRTEQRSRQVLTPRSRSTRVPRLRNRARERHERSEVSAPITPWSEVSERLLLLGERSTFRCPRGRIDGRGRSVRQLGHCPERPRRSGRLDRSELPERVMGRGGLPDGVRRLPMGGGIDWRVHISPWAGHFLDERPACRAGARTRGEWAGTQETERRIGAEGSRWRSGVGSLRRSEARVWSKWRVGQGNSCTRESPGAQGRRGLSSPVLTRSPELPGSIPSDRLPRAARLPQKISPRRRQSILEGGHSNEGCYTSEPCFRM